MASISRGLSMSSQTRSASVRNLLIATVFGVHFPDRCRCGSLGTGKRAARRQILCRHRQHPTLHPRQRAHCRDGAGRPGEPTSRSSIPASHRPPSPSRSSRHKTSNHNPQTRTYTLDPGEARRFEDALMSMFGFDGAAALRVVNTEGMAAITSRTYNLDPTGTFGQFVGGVIRHTAIENGQEGRIIQLTHNRSTTSGYRTNIGFVNATGSQISVRIDMYRADGSYLGTSRTPSTPTSSSRSTRSSRRSPAETSRTAMRS